MESEQDRRLPWFKRSKINSLGIVIIVATVGIACSVAAVVTAVSFASTTKDTVNKTFANASAMDVTVKFSDSLPVGLAQQWLDLVYPISVGNYKTEVYYLKVVNEEESYPGLYNCKVYYVDQCSECFDDRQQSINEMFVGQEFELVPDSIGKSVTVVVLEIILTKGEKWVPAAEWDEVQKNRLLINERKTIVQFVDISTQVTLSNPINAITSLIGDSIVEFLLAELKTATPSVKGLNVRNAVLHPTLSRQNHATLKMTLEIQYLRADFLTMKPADFKAAVSTSIQSVSLIGMKLDADGGTQLTIIGFLSMTDYILGVTGNLSSKPKNPTGQKS